MSTAATSISQQNEAEMQFRFQIEPKDGSLEYFTRPNDGANAFTPEEKTLGLLHEISQELTAILDWDPLLNHIARVLGELMDYQYFNLYLWDPTKEELINRFSTRFGETLTHRENLTLDRGVCGVAARKKKAMRIADVRNDPRFLACDPNFQAASELAAPLLIKNRLIGVINLESTTLDAFSDIHERIIKTLASSIAIALDNAQLVRQLQAKKAALAHDLSMAKKVQKGLLPQRDLVQEGIDLGHAYKPANHLGGDFFDYLLCESERPIIAVGDVSGKGTAAALYVAMIIGALRGPMVKKDEALSRLLNKLNCFLLDTMPQNRFLALLLAQFDKQSQSLNLVNSGMPHPVLVRNGKVTDVPIVGVPLGMFPHSRYQPYQQELQKDDVIVMFSDGIAESTDCRDREFGETILAQNLISLAEKPAPEIARDFLDASVRHSCGTCRADDRTVVVIKKT